MRKAQTDQQSESFGSISLAEPAQLIEFATACLCVSRATPPSFELSLLGIPPHDGSALYNYRILQHGVPSAWEVHVRGAGNVQQLELCVAMHGMAAEQIVQPELTGAIAEAHLGLCSGCHFLRCRLAKELL